MSAEENNLKNHHIEIVGRSDGVSDAGLWGAIPPEHQLEWLRAAARFWPFFPGATVGGLTARALSEGHLVHSESLIRVARNAYEAGFTPDEYVTLRQHIRGRVPERIVVARDPRTQYAASYLEIDARRCRAWLARVRAGYSPDVAADLFLASQAVASDEPDRSRDDAQASRPSEFSDAVEFGSGQSMGRGWGIPFGGGRAERRGWWRVFEVYPPRKGIARSGTGKYASHVDGLAWESALDTIATELVSAGFTPEDLYVLSMTLERLDDDQWARVDKRLFVGEGIHTRAGWMLSPIPEKWREWPRLVHTQGLLPHEATETVLGGVWRGRAHRKVALSLRAGQEPPRSEP